MLTATTRPRPPKRACIPSSRASRARTPSPSAAAVWSRATPARVATWRGLRRLAARSSWCTPPRTATRPRAYRWSSGMMIPASCSAATCPRSAQAPRTLPGLTRATHSPLHACTLRCTRSPLRSCTLRCTRAPSPLHALSAALVHSPLHSCTISTPRVHSPHRGACALYVVQLTSRRGGFRSRHRAMPVGRCGRGAAATPRSNSTATSPDQARQLDARPLGCDGPLADARRVPLRRGRDEESARAGASAAAAAQARVVRRASPCGERSCARPAPLSALRVRFGVHLLS
jgi:hypothetical protein